MFPRCVFPSIARHFEAKKPKVLTLFGPRQVGKTTLLKTLADGIEGRVSILNGDFVEDRALLKPERAALERLAKGADFLFIDEAQSVDDIGVVLKLLHDEHPGVRVLATGSSSFDLSHRTGEPLTGRQRRFTLYPIAYSEIDPPLQEQRSAFEHGMVFGAYPEALLAEARDDKVDYLRQIVADYLLRDIYREVEVNRSKLTDMLAMIAFQIGNEVSLSEVGRAVQLDHKTVSRYVDLLEQAFVVTRLRGFSRNLRKEVAKSQKIYFLDLGVRNALVQNFKPLSQRDDVGALWENYLVVERIKRSSYARDGAQHWFWRTYDRQEIDLIEQRGESLAAFEFKWSSRKARVPKLWSKTYPEASEEIVTRDTAHAFIEIPSLTGS